jgi:hypothetical protein
VLGLYFLIPAGRDAGRLRLAVDAIAALAGLFLPTVAIVALTILLVDNRMTASRMQRPQALATTTRTGT